MAKENEKIKFLKIRDVKNPTRSFDLDAGIDFYVPKINKSFVEDLKKANPDFFKEENTINNSNNANNLYFTNSNGVVFTGGITQESIRYSLTDINVTGFKFDEAEGKLYFLLPPHSRINIPSGYKCRMAKPGRAFIAANKSGVATKHGLIFGAEVVDFSYTGEIHINVINTSTKLVRIYEDMKLIQFVETPIFNSEIDVTEGRPEICSQNPELDEKATKFWENIALTRGEKGFGSTDKK